jgi:hypothetical protein
MGRIGRCLALAAAFTVGCSSDNDKGSSGAAGANGIVVDPNQVGTAATECAAYCQKQANMCRNSQAVNYCNNGCVGIATQFPTCERIWSTLNHCMVLDQLVCDATGGPATTRCLSYADAFGTCMTGTFDGG